MSKTQPMTDHQDHPDLTVPSDFELTVREQLLKVYREAYAEGQRAEQARLRTALEGLQAIVNQQAEDDGLWFKADSIVEAYFQQELRRLHAAIEAIGDDKC